MRNSLALRLLSVLLIFILVASVLPWALSLYISSRSLEDPGRQEITEALRQGALLLDAWSSGELSGEALNVALNPALNPGRIFVVLLDAEHRVIGMTKNAETYAALDSLTLHVSELDSSRIYAAQWGDALVLAARAEGIGCVVAGKPGSTLASIGLGLGAKTVKWLAPVAFLCLLGAFLAFRRAARPATLVVDAATRLSRGENVLLPDNLPGEVGEVARAFNQMARSLQRNIDDLLVERNTMELVLEGLSEGILAVDEGGRVIMENEAAHRLLSPVAAQTLRKALLEGEQSGGLMPSGEATLSYKISPLPGLSRGRVALIRDVTEQERLEKTRYEYVANISHELRTPLATLRGLAEGLRDGMVDSDDARMKCYRMMAAETLRLSRLVTDLLELSSLQSSPAAFELSPVDVTDMMYDLSDRHQKLFADKGLSLELSLSTTPMPEIVSNEDRLLQVLTIFLDNARKFTPAGGRVTLRAELRGDDIYFSVRDTGIGMSEDTVRHAFERFRQADPSRSDKGSGLGLAIAKEVLGRMGIEITIKSAPGEGSEFGFSVPRGAVAGSERT